jgi:hypothetical protein
MTNLVGGYEIHKSDLKRGGVHLVIGTRHKPSANKSKRYLLQRLPNQSHNYISGLYPIQSDHPDREVYQLDFGGSDYTLTLNRAEGIAEIRQIRHTKKEGENKCPLYINKTFVSLNDTNRC